jgi:uncharacterized protein with HEPN domain
MKKHPRSDRLRLRDILDAIAEISQSLPSQRNAFDNNRFLQAFIFMQVMIVGEAAYQISKVTKSANPQIP